VLLCTEKSTTRLKRKCRCDRLPEFLSRTQVAAPLVMAQGDLLQTQKELERGLYYPTNPLGLTKKRWRDHRLARCPDCAGVR